MASKADDTDNAIDAGAKVIELQKEWERSRAFLAELETCFPFCSPGADKPVLQPTAWARIDEDEEAFSAPDAANDPISLNTSPFIVPEARRSWRDRRGLSDTVAPDAPQPRRHSVPQIHLKFESLDDLGVEPAMGDDASGLPPPPPRQPKPPPLQRAGSFRQRGPPPVSRARLLRGSTFGSSGAGEQTLAQGLELSTIPTAAAATTPTASTTSTATAVTAPGMHSATRIAASRPESSTFHTVRRFSMDFDHRRGTGGWSPALVPTVVGTAARRISLGPLPPGWDSESAAKAASGGVGGTLSFRRMEISRLGLGGGGDPWASDGSGSSSNRNSFSGEKRCSTSGVTAAATATALPPPPTLLELPPLRVDPAGGRPSGPDSADAAAAAMLLRGGAAVSPRLMFGWGPSDAGRPAPPPGKLLASQSFPRSVYSDFSSGTKIGVSEDGALDGAALGRAPPGYSLPPPRAIGRQPSFRREQSPQPQPPQGQNWVLSSSSANTHQEPEEEELQPPPPQQQQQPLVLAGEPVTPVVPAAGFGSHGSHSAARTASQGGALRLHGIPEAAAAAARSSTQQVPEPGGAAVLARPSGGGGSGGAGGSGRFGGWAAHDGVLVGGGAGAVAKDGPHRKPRFSWGLDVFAIGSRSSSSGGGGVSRGHD